MHQALKVAISGKSGCGNTTVSKLLAQTLDLRMINYTFRNLAQERGIDFGELRLMAESDPSWDRYLDDRQVELAAAGKCVLGSRLAIWLLGDAHLKVYLKAEPAVRAARIQERELREGKSRDIAEIAAETADRDRRDRERYIKIYGIDNDRYDFADLVIDVSSRRPETILEDIIYALRIKKLL